jgi:predicted PurR-regulated permease PerM
LAIVLLFLLPNFWSQLSLIVTKLPTTIKSAADWAQLKFSYLQARNPELYQQVSQHISDYVHNPEGITGPIVNFVKNSFSQLGGFTASVLNLILIPLFVYYILVDFHKLSRTLYSVIPPRHSTTVSALFQQVDGVLRNFVRGQLLVCTAMSGLYVIGFLIIGVPMGFSLGILSGFGHLVPYFGTAAAAILAIGFTALDGHVWWHILVVIAMYPIVQTIEGFVLTPRILGEKLELHPSLVLVGIIIGHHLFGILGIALAAPVMACLKVFLAFLYHLYLNSNFYRQIPPFSPPNPMPVPEAKSITDELKVEIDIAPVTQNSVMQD